MYYFDFLSAMEAGMTVKEAMAIIERQKTAEVERENMDKYRYYVSTQHSTSESAHVCSL